MPWVEIKETWSHGDGQVDYLFITPQELESRTLEQVMAERLRELDGKYRWAAEFRGHRWSGMNGPPPEAWLLHEMGTCESTIKIALHRLIMLDHSLAEIRSIRESSNGQHA